MDLNNDGNLDLIIGDANGKLLFFTGNTSGILHDEGSISIAGNTVNFGFEIYPYFVDWNNNGKYDLVLGMAEPNTDQRYGHIRLYLNTGTKTSYTYSTYTKLMGSAWEIRHRNPAPNVVDINDDGKKDLILGNYSSDYVVYLNAGTDANPSFPQTSFGTNLLKIKYKKTDNSTELIKSGYSTSFLDIKDINNDGSLDIIAGGIGMDGINIHYGNKGTTSINYNSNKSTFQLKSYSQNDRLTIIISGKNNKANLKLFDTRGKTIKKISSLKNNKNITFNIANIPPGKYLAGLKIEGYSFAFFTSLVILGNYTSY